VKRKRPKKPVVRHPGIAQTLLRKAGPIKSDRFKRVQNKERKMIQEQVE
jgi:hypothetical protein